MRNHNVLYNALKLLRRFGLQNGTSPRSRWQYSTSTTSGVRREVVHVRLKAKQSLQLDVYKNESFSSSGHPHPVILHFPGLPLPLLKQFPSLTSASSSLSNEDDLSAFARAAGCTLVSVHYRLSPASQPDQSIRFPTPIYDAATAYDWAVSNLIFPRNDDSETAATSKEVGGKIGTLGEFIGGSLALGLGLTECRLDDAARVTAVQVTDPIVDWVFEGYNTHQSSQKGTKVHAKEAPSSTLEDLKALREVIFRRESPATHFDPFASPVHFLRSPSAPVPPRDREAMTAPKDSETVDSMNLIEEEADFRHLVGGEEFVFDADGEAVRVIAQGSGFTEDLPVLSAEENVSNDGTIISPEEAQLEAVREASASATPTDKESKLDGRIYRRRLRYPPPRHLLVPPTIRMEVTQGSLLQQSCEEFARLYRRAIARLLHPSLSKLGEKQLRRVLERSNASEHLQDDDDGGIEEPVRAQLEQMVHLVLYHEAVSEASERSRASVNEEKAVWFREQLRQQP